MLSSRPKGVTNLLKEFETRNKLSPGKFILFEGVNGKDVYNITAPFEIDGRFYIAGRIETRELGGLEGDSEIKFFEKRGDIWSPAPGTPVFRLEDTFVTKISGELIVGGVEVFPHPDTYSRDLGFRTLFFKGKNLNNLTRFAAGPDFMKDIRLLELNSGEIAVFTRPQSLCVRGGGKGKIGFITIPNLQSLNEENILKAKIIEEQFQDEEWGGTNELHILANDLIGVVGHIAYMDKQKRKHYFSMAFTFNPVTEKPSVIKIIAIRKNFPPSPAKRSPELDDVIFSGGLIRRANGTAILYAGLSDACAGCIQIPDPFLAANFL